MGSLDNIVRPYLISRGVRMPMVLIVLGVLGGIVTLGLLGGFLGPVLLAVTYTLIQDWERVRAVKHWTGPTVHPGSSGWPAAIRHVARRERHGQYPV